MHSGSKEHRTEPLDVKGDRGNVIANVSRCASNTVKMHPSLGQKKAQTLNSQIPTI